MNDLSLVILQFTADGQPKLADFGVSRVTKSLEMSTVRRTNTEMGSIDGTAWYSAPEVLVKYERAQRWSDVWSMCGTLVEWFSLQDLWKKTRGNMSLTISRYAEKEETPHGLKHVGDERVRGFLSRGLAYNKRHRPSAEELGRSMEELISEGW